MSGPMHELVDLYALDALEEPELSGFEEHLASCEECQARLAEARRVTDRLGGTDWVEPPAHVKDKVMASLDTEATSASPRTGDLTPSPWRWVLGVAAAVALIALVAVTTLGGSSIDDVLTAEDRVDIALAGDTGTVQLAYSATAGAGVLIAEDLTEAPNGQVYQAWLITGEQPASAGTFSGTEPEVLLEGDPALADVVGITLEPEGGSAQPTGDILFVAEISA